MNTCESCKYFDKPPTAFGPEHGACRYARDGANVRDWTINPKQPEDSCPKYAQTIGLGT